MRDNLVMLVGRLLLAWIFLHEGAFLLVNYSASSAAMAKMGAPSFALALGLFCLATAMLFHTNFAIRNELLYFEKDIAIAGGMFVLTVCGAGRWSIDGWRRAGPGP